MHITIQVPQSQDADHDMLNLDVGPGMTIRDLKAAVAIDTNVAAERQVLFLNGDPLADGSKTLEEVGMHQGDIVVMQVRRAPATPARSQRQPPGPRIRDDAEILRLQALGEPRVMEQLRRYRPQLANAIQDPRQFREVWDQMIREQDEIEKEKEMNFANADPFDVEAQKKIEEIIRENAVMQNITETMENTPEADDSYFAAFGRVHMLYIPVEVNGVAVKAFVDSGAQATIMSPSCAEKCNIMRLLDKRFSGIARGVGTARILGRIHSAMIKIGTLHLACSFTVMEGKDVDLLLGLDMLKRHQACIDLKKGALVIGHDEIQFLGEGDIPKSDVMFSEEPTVEGPGGMQVGGRSGAIKVPSTEQSNSTNQQGREQGVGEQSAAAFPPERVAQLMDLGFSREEVLRALQLAGGNLDVAAGILYQ